MQICGASTVQMQFIPVTEQAFSVGRFQRLSSLLGRLQGSLALVGMST